MVILGLFENRKSAREKVSSRDHNCFPSGQSTDRHLWEVSVAISGQLQLFVVGITLHYEHIMLVRLKQTFGFSLIAVYAPEICELQKEEMIYTKLSSS